MCTLSFMMTLLKNEFFNKLIILFYSPYQITEEDLKKTFEKFGEVHEVVIPKKSEQVSIYILFFPCIRHDFTLPAETHLFR